MNVLKSKQDRSYLDQDGNIYLSPYLTESKKRLTLVHELSHLILRHQDDWDISRWLGEFDRQVQAQEMMAWRLTKAILKAKYWDEKFALKSLRSYFHDPQGWRCYSRKYQQANLEFWRRIKKIGIIPFGGKTNRADPKFQQSI